MSIMGEYGFYTPDHQAFAKNIADCFQTNIFLFFCDSTSDIKKPEKYLDFGYKTTHNLSIEILSHDEDNEDPGLEEVYWFYNLYLVGDIGKYKQDLTLEFQPNGIFLLGQFPCAFYGRWWDFIDKIKGQLPPPPPPPFGPAPQESDLLEDLRPIRECYIGILSKIGRREVVVWPVGLFYRAEDEFIYNQAPRKISTLEEFKGRVGELDGLVLYPLLKSIREQNQFDNQEPLRIAFVDNFGDDY